MADMHTGEFHQDVNEFFPTEERLGSTNITAAKGKIMALVSSVFTTAVAVVFMLSMYVDCVPQKILSTSAQLAVSISNKTENIHWQLVLEGQPRAIQSGVLENEKSM
ncbi:MAG: hypothetical protein IJ362_02370, partial [Oscillospiraceae bacterium]|nr:hypothetical protein [Oscillospiraceae bacterium]